MMSATQTSPGRLDAKFCSRRLSATGSLCFEFVVALNFLTCLHLIPSFLLPRFNLSRPMITPSTLASSSCNRSGPYVPRPRSCATWRVEQSGCWSFYAASFSSACPSKFIPGNHLPKIPRKSPFRVWTRVCNSRCAPRWIQRICCFFTKRLLTT